MDATRSSRPEEGAATLLLEFDDAAQQLVVELSARAGVGRPQLPNDDEIRRVGYAPHQALRKVADNADAEQLAADFQRVFEALVAAAKR